MTIIAPVTEMMIPATLIRVSLSLKKQDEKSVIKTGHVATISAARDASIILRPLKKKTLYVNMPDIPSRKTGMIWARFIFGSLPSTFHVSKTRKTEAIANLKKAAEKGSTSLATILPAINVPPQNIAVSNSFA
jgi:hypothetical protein